MIVYKHTYINFIYPRIGKYLMQTNVFENYLMHDSHKQKQKLNNQKTGRPLWKRAGAWEWVFLNLSIGKKCFVHMKEYLKKW